MSAGERWDLVVVGAGPAGSAAALGALQADPDLRVLLLDRSDFPRDKSCGDGIAPHVLDVLGEVGAGDLVDDWTPLRRLELSRGGSGVDGTMRREARVVPRRVFDARLVARAVAAGAVLRRDRVTACAPGSLDTQAGALSPRVVVGADGAHSVVRRALLGPRRGQQRALAIRGYAPVTAETAGRQVIRFGERRQPSYAWAFDRGDGLANVGYGELLPADRSASPTRRLLLDRLEELLPGSVTHGHDWLGHHLPLSGWRWEQPDGPTLLAGDAAGLVNPLTGEGIYYAVATGLAAGRTAARCLATDREADAGRLHRADVRRLLARHLRHTWAAARLARHPAVLDAGIHAADRDHRVFDTLVELGLGAGRIDLHLTAGLARGLVRTAVRRPSALTMES